MNYVIEILNITKEFLGVIANDNVSLQLKQGEIHALLGENGAGKSTLMNVLFGIHKAEKGTIIKDGVKIEIKNPNDANKYGIGMVHQHFKLVENFTVLENIVLGVETTKKGMLVMKVAKEKITALSEKYNLLVDVNARISDLSVGMQQRVEILKMLYRDNKILIFDEPTSVLTPQEIEIFMNIMRVLSAEGKSIIFITHKLKEIKQIAQRCTILRKGKLIGTYDVKDISYAKMSELMIGRNVDVNINQGTSKVGEIILDVRGLCYSPAKNSNNVLNNITFNLFANEIISIAGIDGNGQSELIDILSGNILAKSGKAELKGINILDLSIRKRNIAGMAVIPENRYKYGLFLSYNLSENLVLKKYYTKEFQRARFIKFNKVKAYSENLIAKFDIRTSRGAKTPSRIMSGGNQQKTIIAREIDYDAPFLIAMQPTRGLDVGAVEYIHAQLLEERDRGKGILLVSYNLDEILKISDRIIVICKGEFVGEFKPKDIDAKELGLYMSGSKTLKDKAN